MARGNGRTWLGTRAELRLLRNHVIDQQLKQLNQLRTQIRNGLDVLVLGDSSCLFGRPGDADPALIPELISRELGGASIGLLAGPGYSSRVHAEVLRILGTLDERPKYVVSSVCVRTVTSIHVTLHPHYCYQHSLGLMADITSARRPIRSFGRGSRPTPEQYAEWRALPVMTKWRRGSTIGEFRSQLEKKGPHPWPRELEQVLFDYFHGEIITPDNQGLHWARELGRQIAAYGVPTASYLTAAPVERGEMNFPGEFAELAETNVALVKGAIQETAGDSWRFVDAGLVDEDFVDSQDGVEHFALSGRLKIARNVAASLRASTPNR